MRHSAVPSLGGTSASARDMSRNARHVTP